MLFSKTLEGFAISFDSRLWILFTINLSVTFLLQKYVCVEHVTLLPAIGHLDTISSSLTVVEAIMYLCVTLSKPTVK